MFLGKRRKQYEVCITECLTFMIYDFNYKYFTFLQYVLLIICNA